MGVRGEIFSNRIILPNRTYFFNVKENRNGDLYLNIVESKNRDSGGFERQSVILFADDLQEFLKGFDESLRVMEKAAREKRHTAKAPGENRNYREDRDNEGRENRERRGGREGGDKWDRKRRNEHGPAEKKHFNSGRRAYSDASGAGGSSHNARGSGARRRDNERQSDGHQAQQKQRKPVNNKRVVVRKKNDY